jgi:hypothetical protein
LVGQLYHEMIEIVQGFGKSFPQTRILLVLEERDDRYLRQVLASV